MAASRVERLPLAGGTFRARVRSRERRASAQNRGARGAHASQTVSDFRLRNVHILCVMAYAMRHRFVDTTPRSPSTCPSTTNLVLDSNVSAWTNIMLIIMVRARKHPTRGRTRHTAALPLVSDVYPNLVPIVQYTFRTCNASHRPKSRGICDMELDALIQLTPRPPAREHRPRMPRV